MKRPLLTLSLRSPGRACYNIAAVALVGFLVFRIDFLATLASLLFAALIASALYCRYSLRGLSAEAHARQPRARSSDAFPLEITLRNRNRWLPICYPFIETRESGESRSELFRYPGYIRPRSNVEWIVHPCIYKRGLQHVEVTHAATAFPFGLVEAIVDLEAHSPEIIVWPEFDPININALLRPATSETPLDEGPQAGVSSSVEKLLIRDYVTGDSNRSINWKLTAKLDKLMVIETRHQTLPKLRLKLDTSEPHWLPRPFFERMLRLVCSLASELLKRKRLAGIELDGNYFPIADGPGLARFLDALSVIEPSVIKHLEPTEYRTRTPAYRIAPDGHGGIALAAISTRDRVASFR